MPFVFKNHFRFLANEFNAPMCYPFVLNHLNLLEKEECDLEYLKISRFLVNFNKKTKWFGGEVREKGVLLLQKWKKELKIEEERKLKDKLKEMFGSDVEDDDEPSHNINKNVTEIKNNNNSKLKARLRDLFGSDSEDEDDLLLGRNNNVMEIKKDNNISNSKDLFGSDSEDEIEISHSINNNVIEIKNDNNNSNLKVSLKDLFGSDSEDEIEISHSTNNNIIDIKNDKSNPNSKDSLRDLFGSDSEDEDVPSHNKNSFMSSKKEESVINSQKYQQIPKLYKNEEEYFAPYDISYLRHNMAGFAIEMNKAMDQQEQVINNPYRFSKRKWNFEQENNFNKKRKL